MSRISSVTGRSQLHPFARTSHPCSPVARLAERRGHLVLRETPAMGDARITRRLAGLGMAATAALALAVTAASPASAQGQILGADRADAVKDSYIVTLKESASPRAESAKTAGSLTSKYGGQVRAAFKHAINGFSVTMTADQARKLAADPTVAYVQQDAVVKLADTQSPVPSWGLDRI